MLIGSDGGRADLSRVLLAVLFLACSLFGDRAPEQPHLKRGMQHAMRAVPQHSLRGSKNQGKRAEAGDCVECAFCHHFLSLSGCRSAVLGCSASYQGTNDLHACSGRVLLCWILALRCAQSHSLLSPLQKALHVRFFNMKGSTYLFVRVVLLARWGFAQQAGWQANQVNATMCQWQEPRGTIP